MIKKYPHNNKGFTFVEVMVALAILSFGIVMIFKVFFVSLDHMSHITSRLYASTLLDNRIEAVERHLRTFNAFPFDLEEKEAIDTGTKEMEFVRNMTLSEVEDYFDIFQLDLSLKWMEGEKEINLSRSAYISNFQNSEE